MATKLNLVPAGKVISLVCEKHDYTRSHVARLMRDFKREIGARKIEARWFINAPTIGEARRRLEKVVLRESGLRRKIGEGKAGWGKTSSRHPDNMAAA